jgi:hypothetical protein
MDPATIRRVEIGCAYTLRQSQDQRNNPKKRNVMRAVVVRECPFASQILHNMGPGVAAEPMSRPRSHRSVTACTMRGTARPILCRNCSVLCHGNIGHTEYRMRAYRKKTPASRRLKRWVRVDVTLIAAGIAALAAGSALNSTGTYTIWSASTGPQAEPKEMGATHSKSFHLAVSVGSQIPDGSRVRVSRLETEVGSEAGVGETKGASEAFATSAPCAAFDDRFYFDRQLPSFDERFASAFGSPGNAAGKAEEVGEHANRTREELAPATASRLASLRPERLNTAEAATGLSAPLDTGGHTAVYDIAARTVYLPNGHRLEAHSGLGSHLDDPRYVNTKMQGPTPPNVYSLTLRERLFHGVRALRLTPTNDGKMFGRAGILAHSYMLGPTGQSNGCVSFRNYPAFLNAYLKGEVDRLVVVDHLATSTGAKTSAANGS